MTWSRRAFSWPWLELSQPSFAGPRTERRAVHLARDPGAEGTYEVVGADPGRRGRRFALDAAAWLVPSTAGATLGEIVDESEEQGGRVDGALAVHILAGALHDALADADDDLDAALDAGALAADQVLVGFDGSVRWRGFLPSWGARRHARVPPGYRTTTPRGESLRMLGELAIEVLTSRRFGARSPSLLLSQLPQPLRAPARALVRSLLEDTLAADVRGAAVVLPRVEELRALASSLVRAADDVAPGDVGALVVNLSPARWAVEQEVLGAVEELRVVAPVDDAAG